MRRSVRVLARLVVVANVAGAVAMLVSADVSAGVSAGAVGNAVGNAAQQPARDTPAARRPDPSAPGSRIAGHVLSADDGRPIRRALVTVGGPELREEHDTLTDENGVFELPDLPAGRYTLTAYKPGYVTLAYGQRRPLQPGTPLDLKSGQELRAVEFRLPRGSVIAGHIFDQDNLPTAGVSVQVMRFQYTGGARTLMPVDSAKTDDQGAFRVWGLNPGDYYVSAVARNYDFASHIAPNASLTIAAPEAETQRAYTPTYYPGVGSLNRARAVRVGLAMEALDINFNLQLVRTSRVSGIVMHATGTAVTSGSVSLAPETGTIEGESPLGLNFSSRIEENGTFTMGSVPPDRYILRARGDDGETPQYAAQPLTVANTDLGSLAVTLTPAANVTGIVTFDGKDPPKATDVSLVATSAEGIVFPGSESSVRPDAEGRFMLVGLNAGPHFIRLAGELSGWSLKAVVLDKIRDVVDTPIELRSGQTLANVEVVLTSSHAEIAGTVTNEQSVPLTDITVLAFPTDSSLWRPSARQFMTGRPDQYGKYRLRDLPPGDYYLVAVDVTEQGEWFEPTFLEQQRAGAARISVEAGTVNIHDFRLNTTR